MTDIPAVDSGVQARMRPIVDAVLKLYGITHEELLKDGKHRGAVEARSTCCWLARRLAVAVTLAEMATVVGVKTHGAVRQCELRIEKLRVRDRWLRENTDALLMELSA